MSKWSIFEMMKDDSELTNQFLDALNEVKDGKFDGVQAMTFRNYPFDKSKLRHS